MWTDFVDCSTNLKVGQCLCFNREVYLFSKVFSVYVCVCFFSVYVFYCILFLYSTAVCLA